ncbi:glycosyltransferase family 4 protein [Pedobacter insulae]|uniref:Glycosyl transferases group 1 n=1 Tax=Pedobacter insulae TaxID=414048 RepID=A0A1I2VVC1_9SPHI|nr:glycosyltransferase family 4 protein [Pedobacter insulae]SFG93165.1 Glycosyl transferases group 1 [Pedobacter insulae]
MPKTEKLNNSVIHSFPGIGIFTTKTITAYQEAGWLNKMLTTIVVNKQKNWVKLVRFLYPSIIYKFKSRNFSEIPVNKQKLYPFKEILRLVAVKFFSLITADKIWEWAELSFDKWAAKQLNSKIKIVHAYEHAALTTFERATQIGIIKILEQTSQHYAFYENLINEQFERYPHLKSTYNERISGDLLLKRNNRKKKEHELADFIICNSTFTKRTLLNASIEEKKIIVIPLAFPEAVTKSPIRSTEIFTFLYAGSLSIRKGTHLLLEVWEKEFANQTNVKLILVGKNLLPAAVTAIRASNIEIHDFVHQSELEKLYDQANIFVFPTLADGFGMVITEAMARGLPVIASDNSAGPDLIEHEHSGLIIKAGETLDLFEKMKWCIDNKDVLSNMGEKALMRAKVYQWPAYQKKLITELSQHIDA